MWRLFHREQVLKICSFLLGALVLIMPSPLSKQRFDFIEWDLDLKAIISFKRNKERLNMTG